MKRQDVLAEAGRLISEDRANQYGDAAKEFRKVANAWEEILQCSIKTYEVALMMAALKLVRAAYNPEHKDSWIDAIGYLALGAEMAVPK